MVEKIAVDDDGLRRVVEVILDLFELGNLGAFGNVERAVVEGETVRPVQARGDDFYLPLAVLVDNRIDLVEDAVADEHGTLITESQRARIGDPTGIDLDLKPLGQLELRRRQLVWRRRERRLWGTAQLGGDLGVGNVGTPRHRGRLRLHGGHLSRRARGLLERRRGCGRRSGGEGGGWLGRDRGRGRLRGGSICGLLCDGGGYQKQDTEHANEYKAPPGQCRCDHDESSLVWMCDDMHALLCHRICGSAPPL